MKIFFLGKEANRFLHRALPDYDNKIADETASVKLSDEARERLKNKLKSSTLVP